MRAPIFSRLKLPELHVRRERPLTGGWVAAISIVLVTSLIWVPMVTCPIGWLPPPHEADSLLGPLLGAQAAIAALTLAVTLFVMQGVSNRPETDDRVHREYIRRSWVQPIFWSSIVAVGTTGLALLAEELGRGAPVVGSAPGLRNLPLVAATAFGFNLLLAGTLFEQAIHLARPSQWNALQHDITARDAREATQVFLERYRRVATTPPERIDLADMFPDPAEGTADEAIRALLDGARRGMDERRLADVRRVLTSIEELVEDAMDELERGGIAWGPPGPEPQWPPVRELGRNLYAFREDVIRRGDREYAFEMLRFDYRLLSKGVRRRCGELFTAALSGYRWNYEIATRVGNTELREVLRDRTWLVADQTLFAVSPEEAFPYARHLVRHQEQLLSDAMHADRRGDYEELARGFDRFLEMIRLGWRVEDWPRQEAPRLYEQLEQRYRIALMGLGGRAVVLASAGNIADAVPYLEVARSAFVHPQQLADDVSQALVDEEYQGFSLWLDWDTKRDGDFGRQSVDRQRYPLTYFSVRLLELATSQMPTLDLHGSAEQVLNWFTVNSEGLERHVRADPDTSMEQRREVAMGALRDAVRRDDVAEDERIIQRELSAERIAAFKAGVYASAFMPNTIERIFARADAFLYLSSGHEDAPLRGTREFIPKGPLAVSPERARIYYAPLHAERWGRMFADGVLQDLCTALDDAPVMTASLGSSQELLRAIDGALESLNPQGQIILLLAGDWFDVLSELARQASDGYQHPRQIPEADRCGETGRYLGHPIIRGPHDGDRRLYVVEPGTWGCFVRAQVEGGQDLLVEVDAISLERAREHLGAHPDSFSGEPDEASKLRKWQTFVEVGVAARTEFRVADASRARRIVHTRPAQSQGDEPPPAEGDGS
ncbi:MAG: hypothetical protein OXG38_01590 [Chloroflexi bacterium]|nr:hypothetical protein [Chloroflexota bacterium]